MTPSLRALLADSLDYAGLFPPARLPLAEAIRNDARYRGEPEAWMLSHFVCPAARLAEFSPPQPDGEPARHTAEHVSPPTASERVPLGDDFFTHGPLPFSALGGATETPGQFLQQLDADLAAIAAFRARFGERVMVDMYEVRLPTALLEEADEAAIEELLTAVSARFEQQGVRGRSIFYEASLAGDWRARIGRLMPLLAAHNQQGILQPAALRIGFKLRTGGLEAAAYPTAEQVAFVIAACRDAHLPWKATAGLHHPFGGLDAKLGCRTFGFLNLFGAAALALAHGLDARHIQNILEDNHPEHFAFDEDAFRWQELRATTAEIAQARRETLLSFGSCSFDEPRQDLAALGWL